MINIILKRGENTMKLIISGYGAKPENTLALYSLKDEGIQALWRDSVENASFVCGGDDGAFFTLTEAADHAVVYLYRRQGAGYRCLDQRRLEGGSLCHIVYSSRNKALFGACYETGTVFSIRVEGESFGELLFQEIQRGSNPADMTRAHCVLLNQAETEQVVINIALDRCYFYEIKAGYLFLNRILEVPKGSGPRHALFSGDERLLYIITEYSNEILVYENGKEKRLLQRISTLSQDFTGGSNCSTLCFSQDGRYLYAANRGAETVSQLEVKEDGTLAWLKEYDCGGSCPRHMLVSRDGNYLIVCNQNTDNVSVFRLDTDNGSLQSMLTSVPFPAPAGVFELS
jgi:6-phosphogluconolactonase